MSTQPIQLSAQVNVVDQISASLFGDLDAIDTALIDIEGSAMDVGTALGSLDGRVLIDTSDIMVADRMIEGLPENIETDLDVDTSDIMRADSAIEELEQSVEVTPEIDTRVITRVQRDLDRLNTDNLTGDLTETRRDFGRLDTQIDRTESALDDLDLPNRYLSELDEAIRFTDRLASSTRGVRQEASGLRAPQVGQSRFSPFGGGIPLPPGIGGGAFDRFGSLGGGASAIGLAGGTVALGGAAIVGGIGALVTSGYQRAQELEAQRAEFGFEDTEGLQRIEAGGTGVFGDADRTRDLYGNVVNDVARDLREANAGGAEAFAELNEELQSYSGTISAEDLFDLGPQERWQAVLRETNRILETEGRGAALGWAGALGIGEMEQGRLLIGTENTNRVLDRFNNATVVNTASVNDLTRVTGALGRAFANAGITLLNEIFQTTEIDDFTDSIEIASGNINELIGDAVLFGRTFRPITVTITAGMELFTVAFQEGRDAVQDITDALGITGDAIGDNVDEWELVIDIMRLVGDLAISNVGTSIAFIGDVVVGVVNGFQLLYNIAGAAFTGLQQGAIESTLFIGNITDSVEGLIERFNALPGVNIDVDFNPNFDSEALEQELDAIAERNLEFEAGISENFNDLTGRDGGRGLFSGTIDAFQASRERIGEGVERFRDEPQGAFRELPAQPIENESTINTIINDSSSTTNNINVREVADAGDAQRLLEQRQREQLIARIELGIGAS